MSLHTHNLPNGHQETRNKSKKRRRTQSLTSSSHPQSQTSSSSSSSPKNNKSEQDIETRIMRSSIQKRIKRDAMLRLILPTEEGVRSGSYLQNLRAFCKSILLSYEQCYEKEAGLCIEPWIKEGIQLIIDHPDYAPKLALIFFTLSKEQWLANDFVPPPRLVHDSRGVPQQVLSGEPKVDPSKFVKYMRHVLIPLTQNYLNGEEDLDLQKYVRRAAFGWLSTGSDLPIEEQLRFMEPSSSS